MIYELTKGMKNFMKSTKITAQAWVVILFLKKLLTFWKKCVSLHQTSRNHKTKIMY